MSEGGGLPKPLHHRHFVLPRLRPPHPLKLAHSHIMPPCLFLSVPAPTVPKLLPSPPLLLLIAVVVWVTSLLFGPILSHFHHARDLRAGNHDPGSQGLLRNMESNPRSFLFKTIYSPLSNLLAPIFPLTDPKLRLLLNAWHQLNLTIATSICHRPLFLSIVLHNSIRPANTISSQPTTREPGRKDF
jgi:hypothetical protein